MRVMTDFDVIRGRVNVYVELLPGMFLTGDNEHQSVEPGALPPMFMSLPDEIAQLLKVELDGGREPATNRHLTDAIEVRDRLLTLVEAQHMRESA